MILALFPVLCVSLIVAFLSAGLYYIKLIPKSWAVALPLVWPGAAVLLVLLAVIKLVKIRFR